MQSDAYYEATSLYESTKWSAICVESLKGIIERTLQNDPQLAPFLYALGQAMFVPRSGAATSSPA